MNGAVPCIMRFLLLLLFGTAFVDAANGLHHRHHELHNHDHRSTTNAQLSIRKGNATDAEEVVNQALAILTEVNKARLENPRFNKNEFKPHTKGPHLAAPLDFRHSNGTLQRRQKGNSSDESISSYSIPPELAEAARIVAESTPQVPSGNHAELAAEIRKKYALKTNDTNAPHSLKTPEGKLSVYGDDSISVSKRASAYWMVDMGSFGSSPLAPAGYKVWRNVKDYGAKGDGVTDDTKAINKAISDGGRCGPNCGSSTIFPAVVYFPPGTYLVSSPIIQYYNTEFLGDPLNVPTLLAASSFVGQGVIVSDVYVSDDTEWYLNTANFLRSIKNFKIDIRRASPSSYMCGIHWQVAQATSLENIEFYMLFESDVPGNNQQGIYMENGSGGFLADLTFVGGKFGAYFGNQQFTSSHLIFVRCVNALQVHWDWAWTMHDFVIESCGNGLVIVGGAGGPKSAGQGVGSLVLLDSIIANTKKGIVTTLLKENSTALLIQNVGFFNTEAAITEESQTKPLLAGGNQVVVDSWGFGMVTNATSKDGQTFFANAVKIPAMKRDPALVGDAYPNQAPSLFTRRRPKYYDIPANKVMNVKALGAKGDGVTDDTNALNSILEGAANTSSVVYFPFGIYLVRDTIRVPVGSRIIGQVWSQIMGTGNKFADEAKPRPIIQVGKSGDKGIVEIQGMMFTVKGGTAGAVVVEWNVHQTSKGSAGLWDSHIRVGGAKGSDLSAENCPKKTGHIQTHCKAASLLMHLTPDSTAYIENAWLWTADHDLDKAALDQIDIYAGRGLLVQSETAWLWGTSVEHNVFYQYQLSNAKNIMMGMIQTESPYFQPVPKAPQPFTPGLFPNDPTFSRCSADSARGCDVSWAVRIIDSASIYILGAGLYSWFVDYNQDCVKTENCQVRGFEVEQTSDIWIYNLCTKAIEEMISPLGSLPTYANKNQNGFLSSVLAWLQGSVNPAGERNFEGYRVWTADALDSMSSEPLPDRCKSALTEIIRCDNRTERFQSPGMFGWLGSQHETDSVCDKVCGQSLKSWFDNVASACSGYRISDALPTLLGGRIWSGYNQTCLKDTTSGKYCGEIMDGFKDVDSIEGMPDKEICSYCWIEHLAAMQRSQYSAYDGFLESQLQYTLKRCGKTQNTTIPASPINLPDTSSFCLTNKTYTTLPGETCDSIAMKFNVSSASLYGSNPDAIRNCSEISTGTKLCMPPSCGLVWQLQPSDTCFSIETNLTKVTRIYSPGFVRKFNRWVDADCTNLHVVSKMAFGNVLCVSPENGWFMENSTISGNTTIPTPSSGYSNKIAYPPKDAVIAMGTTLYCGVWHLAVKGDTCGSIAFTSKTTINIFRDANPSIGRPIPDCDNALKPGLTYCAVPISGWEDIDDTMTIISPTTTAPPNGIRTPLAVQSGIIDNCYKFHLVRIGETCSDVATQEGVSKEQLITWNPSLHNDCSGIRTSSYICVGAFTSIPIFQQFGCYTEAYVGAGGSVRALDYSYVRDHQTLTPEFCAIYCMKEKGRALFGLQFASQCWCGDSLALGTTKALDGDCNMPCTGNYTKTCGGPNRLNIYGAQGKPAPLAYRAYGCYTEGTNTRALGIANMQNDKLTMEMCANFCLGEKRTNHFNLQNGRECFCGNNLGIGAVPAPAKDCNVPCAGDAKQTCGGAKDRLSLYSTFIDTPPLNFKYRGCYTEPPGGRALTGANMADQTSLKVESCAKFCIDKGFKIFGLEAGVECWCGSKLETGSALAQQESECNQKCVGNTSQTCGGSSRLSLYQWN